MVFLSEDNYDGISSYLPSSIYKNYIEIREDNYDGISGYLPSSIYI